MRATKSSACEAFYSTRCSTPVRTFLRACRLLGNWRMTRPGPETHGPADQRRPEVVRPTTRRRALETARWPDRSIARRTKPFAFERVCVHKTGRAVLIRVDAPRFTHTNDWRLRETWTPAAGLTPSHAWTHRSPPTPASTNDHEGPAIGTPSTPPPHRLPIWLRRRSRKGFPDRYFHRPKRELRMRTPIAQWHAKVSACRFSPGSDQSRR